MESFWSYDFLGSEDPVLHDNILRDFGMGFFLGGLALLFLDSFLVGGLEFREMGVVVGEEKIHRCHLLWCGIPRDDLAGGFSGWKIRDGWSRLPLERGSLIQIVDRGHAHELPDPPVGCGETADACNEAPVCGGPEDDRLRLPLRLIMDEAAGCLPAAAVDGGTDVEKSKLLLGFEYGARCTRGRQCRGWRWRHGESFHRQLLDGEEVVSKIVGGGFHDLGRVRYDWGVLRFRNVGGRTDHGEGGD